MAVISETERPLKYTATLPHVSEIALRGTAELAPWTAWAAAHQLVPLPHNGRAQLMIMAVDGRFAGLPFRELSISLAAAPRDGAPGHLLVYAYNSSRLLAFAERVLFSTPYYFAKVRLAMSDPAGTAEPIGMTVDRAGTRRLAAKLAAGRPPLEVADECFAGPLYLPRRDRSKSPGKVFYARLSGRTETYAFDPAVDRLQFTPGPDDVALAAVAASNFRPEKWGIRRDATHARSKTYNIGQQPQRA